MASQRANTQHPKEPIASSHHAQRRYPPWKERFRSGLVIAKMPKVVTQIGIAFLACVSVALLASVSAQRPETALAGLVAVVLFVVIVCLGQRYRLRELLLWFVLLVCTFNFTSALFTNQGLSQDVGPERLLKDIPVAMLLVGGFLFARPRRSMNRANPWLALWAFVVVIAAFRASSDSLPLVFSSVRYLLIYPLAGIAVWRLRLTAEESQRVLCLLVGLGVVAALIACAESLGLMGGETFYAGYAGGSDAFDTRAIATLGNPDNLALFLGFPAILLGSSLASRYPIDGVVTAGIALLVVFIGMGLTLSKGAPLALAAALVLQGRGGASRIVRAFLVFGVVATMLFVAYVNRQGEGGSIIGSIQGGRASEVREGLGELVSSPGVLLFGAGFGSVATLSSGGEVATTIADNMILGLAIETGLIGLGVFVGLVWMTVAPLRRRRDPPGHAVFICSIYYLLFAPFYMSFVLFPAALLFWMLPGVIPEVPERSRTSVDSIGLGGRAGRFNQQPGLP